MLQIKNLSITHKKDLRVILNDFSCVLNDGDKAVIIGEEGNGKSTLLKWIYDEKLVGGRDHSTIIHGIKKIADEYDSNEQTRNLIETIKKKINPN